MEPETKPWYQSRTIIASLIAIICLVASQFGYVVAEGDQQLIVELLLEIASGVSTLVAIRGRITATKPIAKKE